MKISKTYYRGCLLGGAVGDALGYPIEMMNRSEILDKFGPEGLKNPLINSETNTALISDDTQLTSFTVDGLLWADARAKEKGIYAYIPCIFYSYQKWLYTQTGNFADKTYEFLLDGEILRWEELFARRGPGKTSLVTLSGCINGKYGTLKNPINNSKGSGAVMRAAPVGLYFYRDAAKAFRMGCEAGAITHGHSCGYLPAGFFSYLIACILNGEEIEKAAEDGMKELATYRGFKETATVIEKALELAAGAPSNQEEQDIKNLAAIGEGWTGEEALAAAIYCAIRYKSSFAKALRLAVNLDGNGDTIGSICGNLLGTYLGSLEIPYKWLQDIELYDLMVYGADKLLAAAAE